MISTLARQTGGIITEGAASWWHWQGRAVRLVDGATLTLADTEENQAAYPQSNSQKAGLGFPICRLVTLLCLGSGALLDAAVGPCKGKGSDEQTLLREVLEKCTANHPTDFAPPIFNVWKQQMLNLLKITSRSQSVK